MARYSAQLRNNVLRKLLPPHSKPVGEEEETIVAAVPYGV